MRTPALILTAAMATLLAGPASPQDKVNPSPRERVDASARKARDLQKERIAVLKELLDQTSALFRNARVPYDEVLEAQMLLLNAELDAAETEPDRVALYKKALDHLKAYEEVARAQKTAGRGNELASLKIKARRLEVEIQLERAKIKEAKQGK